MSGDVWLVRHGETEWSRTGRHTGRSDIPLTAVGRREARALRKTLGGRRFALVLSSPLSRAWETCRIAGYARVARKTALLREWDYGDVDGRTAADVRRERPGWDLWKGPVPHGETLEELATRARAVIRRCARARGDVLLFGHGHILRVLAVCWIGLAPAEARRFALSTASLGVLGAGSGVRMIRAWNVGGGLKPGRTRGSPRRSRRAPRRRGGTR